MSNVVTTEALSAAVTKAAEQAVEIVKRRIIDVREAFLATTEESENNEGMFTVSVKLKIEKTEGAKLNISSVVGWGVRVTEASGTVEMDPNQPDLFTNVAPDSGSDPDPDPAGGPAADHAAEAGTTKKNGKRSRKSADAAA